MPTKTQLLQSTGEFFHAFNRGVNRERIFFRDEDYGLFLRLVPEALNGIGISILSYCLMPNHFHFELQQNEPYGMAHFFKRLCDRYAKTVNVIHGRVGHLFQGDYTPKLVSKTESLPWLSRYIDRNPVVAGLVKNSTEWEHSSARELCGLRKPTFVDTSLILGLAGGVTGYRSLLAGDDGDAEGDLGNCLFSE